MRLLLALLLGVGLTLAWQAYGEDARQIVGPWVKDTVTSQAPSLAPMLPSWFTPPPRQDAEAKQTVASPAKQTVSSSPVRELPPEEAAAPPLAAISPELAQRLEAMARDLAAVGRSVEQLGAKQDQIVGKITTLQAEIGQKLSSLNAPPPAPKDNGPRPAPAPAPVRGAPSPQR